MAGTEDDLAAVAADPRRAAANALAVELMFAARPHWSTSCPPGDALGLRHGQFLHAGPPIGWDRASGPLRGALIGAAVYEGLAADPDAAAGMAGGASSRSRPATPAARWARWPAWSRRPCGSSSCEDPATGSRPTAR